ncbi:MAG: acyl carrier protein [bacterium]
MTNSDIIDKISQLLADILDNESIQLTEKTSADQVEDWDSVNHVRLLIALEREFQFEFDMEELDGLKNVGALADVINRKLQA